MAKAEWIEPTRRTNPRSAVQGQDQTNQSRRLISSAPTFGHRSALFAAYGMDFATQTSSTFFKEVPMPTEKREFIIRQDSLPVKVLNIEPKRVRFYMCRLQTRFSDYRWSVSERFLLNGSD
jgi:hypothetical protein